MCVCVCVQSKVCLVLARLVWRVPTSLIKRSETSGYWRPGHSLHWASQPGNALSLKKWKAEPWYFSRPTYREQDSGCQLNRCMWISELCRQYKAHVSTETSSILLTWTPTYRRKPSGDRSIDAPLLIYIQSLILNSTVIIKEHKPIYLKKQIEWT